MIICNLQLMLKVPAFSWDARARVFTSFFNDFVDDRLLQCRPRPVRFDQSLLQLAYVLDRWLVNTFLDQPGSCSQLGSELDYLEATDLDRSGCVLVKQRHWFTGTSGAPSCWKINSSPALERMVGSIYFCSSTSRCSIGTIHLDAWLNDISDRCSQAWTHRPKPWPTWWKFYVFGAVTTQPGSRLKRYS